MLTSRVLSVVWLMVVLSAASTLGKKRKRGRKRESPQDEPQPDNDPNVQNLCDIVSPDIIYCYCNTVDENMAEEGNCWIFNDTSDDKFKNVWEGFSTQTKIKHLTLHLRPDGTLKKIPTVAIRHLPDLKLFEVQYASISKVHSFSFGNSTSVERISLARNSIQVLEKFSFANLPILSKITLGENHLTEIKRNVFTGLPKLTHLYIDRNNITSIEDFAFVELENLKELELFSNQIQVVVPETFKGLYALERLDLHKNWIEVLGDMTFEDQKNLKTLDLRANSIKYIAPKSFYGLDELQKLVLQDNKLMQLNSNVLKYFGKLLYLDLRQNVLETLTKETVHPILPNLKKERMHIYLEDNILRCDTRLLWIFSLHNTTKSSILKKSLEEVVCYLENGELPQRFEDAEITPSFEFTTMGIGPRIQLLKLKPSEIPQPLVRTPATFTQEDCDHEDDSKVKHSKKGHGGKFRGRNRGKKHRTTTASPQINRETSQQNDMASPPSTDSKNPANNERPFDASHEVQPASPVQESRSFTEDEKVWSGASMNSFVCSTLVLVIICILGSSNINGY